MNLVEDIFESFCFQQIFNLIKNQCGKIDCFFSGTIGIIERKCWLNNERITIAITNN